MPESVLGVLVRLLGQFMRGQMICFTVSSRGGGVGVCRKTMEFSGSIVCALWHGVLLDCLMLRPRERSPLKGREMEALVFPPVTMTQPLSRLTR
jgi:hypothetical protein